MDSIILMALKVGGIKRLSNTSLFAYCSTMNKITPEVGEDAVLQEILRKYSMRESQDLRLQTQPSILGKAAPHQWVAIPASWNPQSLLIRFIQTIKDDGPVLWITKVHLLEQLNREVISYCDDLICHKYIGNDNRRNTPATVLSFQGYDLVMADNISCKGLLAKYHFNHVVTTDLCPVILNKILDHEFVTNPQIPVLITTTRSGEDVFDDNQIARFHATVVPDTTPPVEPACSSSNKPSRCIFRDITDPGKAWHIVKRERPNGHSTIKKYGKEKPHINRDIEYQLCHDNVGQQLQRILAHIGTVGRVVLMATSHGDHWATLIRSWGISVVSTTDTYPGAKRTRATSHLRDRLQQALNIFNGQSSIQLLDQREKGRVGPDERPRVLIIQNVKMCDVKLPPSVDLIVMSDGCVSKGKCRALYATGCKRTFIVFYCLNDNMINMSSSNLRLAGFEYDGSMMQEPNIVSDEATSSSDRESISSSCDRRETVSSDDNTREIQELGPDWLDPSGFSDILTVWDEYAM